MPATTSWETKAAARRHALAQQLPKEWTIAVPPPEELSSVQDLQALVELLTPLEIEITTAKTPEILSRLRNGEWTSEATVTAFCKRAAVAQQALNCATDLLFDEAIQTAREHDAFLESTGKTKGPLHGLPISVKDVFDVAGHVTTHGLVSRLDDVAREDALIVSILRGAGAIPFVKTATSQACLLVESTSNVFGTVRNPHNRALSAGGSSGGEGALVAFRGSPLGVGTDGGGSLRIPAAWCGAYTLKPTSGRLPGYGRGVGYSDSGAAGYGPLAGDLDAVAVYCEAVLAAEPWRRNPAVVPIPWRADVVRRRCGSSGNKLRLGFLRDDGITHNSPPVARCLAEAAERLREAGHEIVELDAKWSAMHRRLAGVAFKIYTQEGGVGLRQELEKSGEPLVPRTCTGWSETPLTTMEVWLNHRERKALRMEYLQAYQELGLDAVITAPMPHPAPPHGEYITSAGSAVYNALDYPTCVVPYGRVDLVKDKATEEWYKQEPYPDMPNFPYDRYDTAMKQLYTGPEVFENAPLGLQIACLQYQEEECLAVSKVIDRVLNG
ncbi:amidase signature domain-containing protein [Xylariaceae sp. FL0804]|nr:amidase signature domain-containing protein [Xylariaceae sp. FL0804]